MGAPKGNTYGKGHDGSNAGRPEKYTLEWCAQEAKDLLAYIKLKDSIYLRGFCKDRGYPPQRLTEFAQKSKEFALALDQAKAWQEEKFVQMSLTKQWDPTFARYVMARVCDPMWKASYDKSEPDAQELPPIKLTVVEPTSG